MRGRRVGGSAEGADWRIVAVYAGPMYRVSVVGVVAAVLVVSACTSVIEDEPITIPSTVVTSTTLAPPAPTTSGVGTTIADVEPSTTTLPLSDLTIKLTEIDSGFDYPMLLVADPAGGPDFVVEQPGRIVRADGANHAVALDIRDDVHFGGERGLLGLAFHPDFDVNRLAYVNYTDNRGRTVIKQFEVHDGVFDVAFDRPVLMINQPAGNHNGGMIAFGPLGYLWIGMGDGGAANDAFGNGQDPHTLLGSMLRISVPGSEGNTYDIPESNPYSDGIDGAPEVYAHGLRNPWRFSFDTIVEGENADLWIADVGQNDIEELNLRPSDVGGANYGWPIMEGSRCFLTNDCDEAGLVLPLVEYDHNEGCSITGGYVYHGSAIPELDDHYFYSDFCSGFLRSYSVESGNHDWTEMTGMTAEVSGFGIGGDGELYVVSITGSIYRIERAQ
ncbi:MAG: glucose dehydrogenase [Actinobacteria bacterium]|nr:MAG: glucose dehydrogenase [Actinomycetota bacterium]